MWGDKCMEDLKRNSRAIRMPFHFISSIKMKATKWGEENKNLMDKNERDIEIVSMCTFRRMMYPA